MTGQARLLSVRLQGFKSFAERTQVVFGPGISAIVGPNGSGKSNLADALRWSLGEQGRALRTRKAEDVIWAGSERRPAVGMADVQIVLDNGDGLLPIDFGVVELGRRLFRSGENEYVLNRERVRLRDLVDLLDAAHLAENAFLFIGQGMVDQALALRPEERRPLFEEVAGVRRHDRRRRRAEEQLAEASANMTRIEDVVAELRPQVRRLAAQAEQQASRRDAGVELVESLLLSGHARWHAAATRLSGASRAQGDLRRSIDAATAELRELEAAAAGGSEQLGLTAAAVDGARAELEAARERLSTARVEAASAAAELDAIGRDHGRLTAEHEAASAALAIDRRALAVTIPTVDPALEHEAREAQRAVDEANRELAQARTASLAAAAERDAAERAEARRSADLELARRRAAELDREREDAELAAARASEARDAAGATDAEAQAALAAASARASGAGTVELAAAERVRTNEAALDDGLRSLAGASARLAAAEARLAALREQVHAHVDGSLAAAARSAGGTALLDGVRLDEGLRAAVAAALGESAAAYVVGRERAASLAGERGSVVIEEGLRLPTGGDGAAARAAAGAEGDLERALRATGGGRLADAIRHDPNGHVRALLATAIWVPDLAAALALQPELPLGWVAVTRDGKAVVHGPTVSLGRADGPIELGAAVGAMSDEVESRRRAHGVAEADVERRREALAATRSELDLAQSARQATSEDHAAAAAAAQAAGRRVEAATREAAWLSAQADRARAAAERAAVTLGELDRGANREDPGRGGPPRAETAVGALERRVSALAAIRDRADSAWRTADAGRRDAERERSRAEAAIALGERRIDELEAAMAELAGRVVAAERRKAASSRMLLGAGEAAATAQDALERALGEDAAARTLYGGAERARLVASEALRAREERGRAIEREELEARLSLESVREGLLVELAGLGALGLRHLRAVTAAEADRAAASTEADRSGATATATANATVDAAEEGADEDADAVAALEAALDAAGRAWAAEPPAVEAPSAGRIGALRRRFHELGSANPYALEEHAELSARLDALEAQRSDLVGAVDRTRALIAELDELIARQFRETFGALERAFDERFRQLFGGGFAKLSLTEPGDLATTGIEITARPPGKKPQALAMLSGGERALTAVALLFAMLEVRPVPFCVLDEVDAALDEANVGRFTDALRELGRTTQVIVITHNRGTIETADALYGVTVGDDSVSRVISLRLEEAAAIADRAAGRSGLATAGAAATTVPAPREPILPAGLADLPLEPAG